jgi:1,2-diacylglycerol 3-alpha-glucosyltransferase
VEGYVIFTGFVEDEELPGAYAATDVFCNTGTAELQSIVTMEAMATCKPVVAANAGALPLLVQDGENGHLFEPRNVDTLASRLTEVLSDEGKRVLMGEESSNGRPATKPHMAPANQAHKGGTRSCNTAP